MSLLICVPTYNEAENIKPFITAVFEHSGENADLIVVDDNSPDGTAGIVESMMQENPRLHIMKRPGKQGGATAFLQAFDWGIRHGYDAMLAMDADFSHKPEYIPEIAAKARDYDVVIGSRLVKGGGIENRSIARNLISKGASLYCRILLRCPIHDWTGGYNLWTKNALEKIDLTSVFTRGYSFQIEMKYKAYRAGCRITEVPIMFPDRKYGTSKMPVSFLVKALLDVWRILLACNRLFAQIFKFAFTGGLGTITNLLLFFILVDVLKFPPLPVSVLCFVIAGTQNYIINHKWSFSDSMRNTKPSLLRWASFLCASLLGLAVNVAVMAVILAHFTLPFKFIAQACGILAGMVINFIVSKFVVFRKKKNA